jgi:DNA repair protein RecO (recombination protein O)
VATSRRAAPAPLAAYVLHRHDWSESSLILELWTRDRGRIAAIAKGAKRPHSQLRSVLLPFQRLQIVLGGRAERRDEAAPPEIHLLRSAEWAGALPDGSGVAAMPSGAALLAGFHLNELLMRALPRHDAHPRLFDAYALTLPALDRDDEAATAAALRAFELFLLRESGVLPELGRVTQTQQPVEPQARHGLHAEHGVTAPGGRGGAHLSGATLHALEAALDAGDLAALRQACRGALPALRTLLRGLLHYHLDTSMLRTRALMVELQKLIDSSAPP